MRLKQYHFFNGFVDCLFTSIPVRTIDGEIEPSSHNRLTSASHLKVFPTSYQASLPTGCCSACNSYDLQEPASIERNRLFCLVLHGDVLGEFVVSLTRGYENPNGFEISQSTSVFLIML